MTSPVAVPTHFPYESKYVEVLGSKIHYIEEGSGEPIIFLHGMLTCNYLWRNIIPALKPFGRCIAPDLIGMGKSDKPDIEYRLFDHIRYIEGFIQALNLKHVTLVMHSLGSAIGFHYAMQNETNIKSLAFIEGTLRPFINENSISLPAHEILYKQLKDPQSAYKAVIEENFLMNKVLPMMVMRKLTEEELAVYRAPFLKSEHRKPLLQYVRDLPLKNGPQEIKDLIANYSAKLQKSNLPKLLIYSLPGFFTTIETVHWAKQNLPNLTIADIGEALHCPQETNPQAVCEALVDWQNSLVAKNKNNQTTVLFND